MNYDDLILLLNEHDFYPGKLVRVTSSGNVCVGLFINCPPIMSVDMVHRLLPVTPKEFCTDYDSNKQEIHITKES